MVANKRKSDAHKKILLGIMFHLTNLDKFQGKDDTILLGILEDAANKIHSPDGERHTNYFRSIGEHNFESNLKGWKRKNRSEEPI